MEREWLRTPPVKLPHPAPLPSAAAVPESPLETHLTAPASPPLPGGDAWEEERFLGKARGVWRCPGRGGEWCGGEVWTGTPEAAGGCSASAETMMMPGDFYSRCDCSQPSRDLSGARTSPVQIFWKAESVSTYFLYLPSVSPGSCL